VVLSWTFLAVAVWGGLWTLVSFRPPHRPPWLTVVGFFAAWTTTELAPIHMLWQGAAAVVFIAFGALDAWPGWVALGITLASSFGLAASVKGALQTERVFVAALEEALGPDWDADLDSTLELAGRRIRWSRMLRPFDFERRGVRRISNLQYVDDGDRRHRLDVYCRDDVEGGAPVLLQIHGGAWVIGRKDQQGLPLMYHLASRGWICVAINYRLSPRATWPDHLVDCKRALAWIRANIAQYGGDPGFVVVTGGSAGGHLTALMGLTANDPEFQPGFEDVDTSVRAMIPFYGVFDWTGTVGRNDGLRELLERRVVKRKLAEAPDVFRSVAALPRPARRATDSRRTRRPRHARTGRAGAGVRGRAPRHESGAGRVRRAAGRAPRVRGLQLGPHVARDRRCRPVPRLAPQRCARRDISTRRRPHV
jgi:acetyl esterase/lipase